MSKRSSILNTGRHEQTMHKREEHARAHGQSSSGANVAGVEIIRPNTFLGNDYPIGYEYPTEHGSVKLYDGTIRMIDTQYFREEVGAHIGRRKQIENLAYAFAECDDTIVHKYLGDAYRNLAAGMPNDNSFVQYLMSDGLEEAEARQIVIDIQPIDARPSKIRTQLETSEMYGKMIYKLMLVIRFVGLVFKGGFNVPNPDKTNVPPENMTGLNNVDTRASEEITRRNLF
jgi:hypothetical protein